MAETDEIPIKNAPTEPPKEGEPAKEEVKKEARTLLIRGRRIPLKYLIIAVGVVIALAITITGYFWFFPDKAKYVTIKKEEEIPNKDEETVNKEQQKEDTKGKAAGDTKKDVKVANKGASKSEAGLSSYGDSFFLTIPPFVLSINNDLNLKDPIASLKIQLCFELKNFKLQPELLGKMPQIRDAIVTIISSKKVSDLNNTAGKLKLKDELRKYINSYLKEGNVAEVYFTEFLYQI